MPVCQAVAEIHLGRLPEAEAALQKAMQENPTDIEAISNSIVLNVLSAKDPSELVEWVNPTRVLVLGSLLTPLEVASFQVPRPFVLTGSRREERFI